MIFKTVRALIGSEREAHGNGWKMVAELRTMEQRPGTDFQTRGPSFAELDHLLITGITRILRS